MSPSGIRRNQQNWENSLYSQGMQTKRLKDILEANIQFILTIVYYSSEDSFVYLGLGIYRKT